MLTFQYREKEIARILEEIKLELYHHRDVEEFYEYMGNPYFPILPFENEQGTKESIENALSYIDDLTNVIKLMNEKKR